MQELTRDSSNEPRLEDIILPIAALDIVCTKINEIMLATPDDIELAHSFNLHLASWYEQVPRQYFGKFIQPCIEDCKSALLTRFLEKVKKLLVEFVITSARFQESISFVSVVDKLRDAKPSNGFKVASYVEYKPKFDPNCVRPFWEEPPKPKTLGDQMAGASEQHISAVADAIIQTRASAEQRAKEITERIITKLHAIFIELLESQLFLPYFKISKTFHGFKGLYRPMLLTLLADEMDNYNEQPEICRIYADTISEFTNKEAITTEDFEAMIAKFPRAQMQSQAMIMQEIIKNCALEFIPLTQGENGGLDKVIQKIKTRTYYGFEMTHIDRIKDKAYTLYTASAIRQNTTFEAGFHERRMQWVEQAAIKTKAFIDRYANTILDNLVEFFGQSERVFLKVVQMKISREFKDSLEDNDDLIVYKSSDVRDYLEFSMLKNIFDEVILDPISESGPMDTFEF